MAKHEAADLARRLAREAEAVCRHYLGNGRRSGHYWQVGDVANMPGRSLFVRLHGPVCGSGAAGKWTDAATGQHGDLLDLIALNRGFTHLRDTLAEARAFLRMPEPDRGPMPAFLRGGILDRPCAGPTDLAEAARCLFALSRPVNDTLAEAYLRHRGIALLSGAASLRFHPRCYYRPDRGAATLPWPAMIAAVTDLGGALTGVQRTWLDLSGAGKAPFVEPRRALGHLLGHGVRFGYGPGLPPDIVAAGEGIETILSLRCVLPDMAMVAALSAAHLAALRVPAALRRLYIARDGDPAGAEAALRLVQRMHEAGIEAVVLSPRLKDFNDDLRRFGIERLRTLLRPQLAPDDARRFLPAASMGSGER